MCTYVSTHAHTHTVCQSWSHTHACSWAHSQDPCPLQPRHRGAAPAPAVPWRRPLWGPPPHKPVECLPRASSVAGTAGASPSRGDPLTALAHPHPDPCSLPPPTDHSPPFLVTQGTAGGGWET